MDFSKLKYQDEGVDFLSQRTHCLLADDPGLGKTIQAIRAADKIQAGNILVVCPAIAVINWRREFQKHSVFTRDIGVVSYERAVMLNENWKDQPTEKLFSLLIIDEEHYLKTHTSQRTQAILSKSGLQRFAKRVWALSGTPCPNGHIGELWPLLRVFGATSLGYEAFIRFFCHTERSLYPDAPPKILGNRRDKIPELKNMLRGVMLRRKKADVLPQLPPVTLEEVVVERGNVELTPEMQKLVDEELEAFEHLWQITLKTTDSQMGLLESLAQSVSTLRRYIGLQKVEPAIAIIAHEIESLYYEKLVIFCVHTEVAGRLAARLPNCLTIIGATPPNKRQAAIDRFQHDPTVQFLVANIQAAGTAVTLTAASDVLFVERDWVPANNRQAMDRLHRIGQESPVHARYLTVADSVDEKANNVLRRKEQELARLFS